MAASVAPPDDVGAIEITVWSRYVKTIGSRHAAS